MGAMGAFVGMGMAGNVTGGSMQNLYQMAQNQQGGGSLRKAVWARSHHRAARRVVGPAAAEP